MKEKVLLIDADSTIPNLALMKYATYCKQQGYEVGFGVSNPDIVIASIIFEKNRHLPNSWKFWWPNAQFIIGGPGYDPTIQLPEEVEQCPPDYSIYQDYSDSIGRVTIGCIRKCYFCKVPEMGKIRYIMPVWKQYQGGSMRLLDDNIFAHKEAWNETADWFIEKNFVADFDALDIRLMTSDIASKLAEIKHKNRMRMAFDITAYEKAIRRGVAVAKDGGVNVGNMMFYIYLHDEENIPDAMYRWRIVKDEFEAMPYIMINQSQKLTPRLSAIKSKGCSPLMAAVMTPEEIFNKMSSSACKKEALSRATSDQLKQYELDL